MHRRCAVTSVVVTTVLALVGLAGVSGPAYAADSDVVINEVESSGGNPGDWVELYNNGPDPVSLSGWTIVDSDPSHSPAALPADAVIEPGGFYVIEESVLGFGLGSGDGVTLANAGGTTIASYDWEAHAISSWARCPDGTGDLVDSTSVTKGAANDCSSPVLINEIESSDGDPGDWVELVNPSSAAVDVSGYVVSDNDDGHRYAIPEGTSIPAGGYLVLEESALGFGLGDSDSVRLFTPGNQVVDAHTWTEHATTTYGRCPDAAGEFGPTSAPTKGAANTCPDDLPVAPWPGAAEVVPVDDADLTAGDLSGLDYATDALWAVENGTGRLLKLTWDGSSLAPAAGWADGATLRYPDGTGTPDSEGVTAMPDGTVVVGTERDNDNGGVSKLSVLRYLPGASAATLSASQEWDVTSVLPATGANLGIEAIEWIPDEALTWLVDDTTGATYDPASYPGSGGGLYFVGIEGTGLVHAFALGSDGSIALVATLDPGLGGVMGLDFDSATRTLWAVCDDTCDGVAATYDLSSADYAAPGYVARPGGMPNLNNEGFAIAPVELCSAGVRPVWWADDGDTDGQSVRVGSLPCPQTPPTDPPVTDPPVTDPPVTDPPVTDPPVSDPPVSDPGGESPGLATPIANDGSTGAPGALARTGADSGAAGLIAIGLLASGAALVAAGRRRR